MTTLTFLPNIHFTRWISYFHPLPAEQNAAKLVHKLVELGEKARRNEEILEQMEQERMEAEEWFIVRQEEVENLRKKDVLVAMEIMLAEGEAIDRLIGTYFADKEMGARRAQVEYVSYMI